jgi:hypothetical protein
VQTTRTIRNCKLDSIIRDNEETRMLLDVAILEDRNVIKKETENILKYKDPAIEIQRMPNVKTKVIPIIIIKATGTISKSSGEYLNNIPGKHEINELEQTSLQGTHALESTNTKVQNI